MGKCCQGVLNIIWKVPLCPVETSRRIELETASVTKIPVQPGFLDCRYFMPSAVMVINVEDKMYVPEGTIMGIGQDWEEEEEQEIEDYSELVGAVRGVGEGIPEHMKDMFDKASAGMGADETMALKLLLIQYRGVFAEHDMDLGDFSVVKHVIDAKDERPVKQRPRRTPLAFEGEEKKHLKNFWTRVLFPGCFRMGVSYSVG